MIVPKHAGTKFDIGKFCHVSTGDPTTSVLEKFQFIANRRLVQYELIYLSTILAYKLWLAGVGSNFTELSLFHLFLLPFAYASYFYLNVLEKDFHYWQIFLLMLLMSWVLQIVGIGTSGETVHGQFANQSVMIRECHQSATAAQSLVRTPPWKCLSKKWCSEIPDLTSQKGLIHGRAYMQG